MCRVGIPKVEIRSNVAVPDLGLLAAQKPETAEWLHTQAFQYGSLDSKTVIRILSKSAGISFFALKNKKGSILVYDVIGDNGPTIQRKFNLRRRREGRSITLEIEFEETSTAEQ